MQAIKRKLTEIILVQTGFRKDDSLRPSLFNLRLDKVIQNLCESQGCKKGAKDIQIIYYADDKSLIGETEGNLERLTHSTTGNKYVIISAKETNA